MICYSVSCVLVCYGLFVLPLDVTGVMICDCGSSWTFSLLYLNGNTHEDKARTKFLA